MEGNRLVGMVMLEAMGLTGKVKWVDKLEQSLEEIGWMGVGMEELEKLSKREERICKQCTLGEVEDEAHFVLRCEALLEEDGEEGAKVALILEQACIDQGVGRELERMWRSRFEKRPTPQSPSEL